MFDITQSYFEFHGTAISWYGIMVLFASFPAIAFMPFWVKLKGKKENFFSTFTMAAIVLMIVVMLIFKVPVNSSFKPFAVLCSASFMTIAFGIYGKFIKDVIYGAQTGVVLSGIYLTFIKIGCFMEGCCHGREVSESFPLRVIYYGRTGCNLKFHPFFPAQLFAFIGMLTAIIAVIIFFVKAKPDLITSLTGLFGFCLSYYACQQMISDDANLMIINGFNYSIPMLIITALGTVTFIGIYFNKYKKQGGLL